MVVDDALPFGSPAAERRLNLSSIEPKDWESKEG